MKVFRKAFLYKITKEKEKSMIYQRILPEGWYDEEISYNMEQINNAWQNGEIMQGRVMKCDSSYNLHINLGNNIEGIIPRDEVEAVSINDIGFPKPNICTSKLNKYVQFRVKNIDNDKVILSRKSVGKEVIRWINSEVQVGDVVNGIIKNIRPYGVFVEVGGGIVRSITHRRYICRKNKKSNRTI